LDIGSNLVYIADIIYIRLGIIAKLALPPAPYVFEKAINFGPEYPVESIYCHFFFSNTTMGNTVTWQVINSVKDNVSYVAEGVHSVSSTKDLSPSSSPQSGLRSGAKAGIGVGVSVPLIFIVSLVTLFFCLKGRRLKTTTTNTEMLSMHDKSAVPAEKPQFHVLPTELPVRSVELPVEGPELPATGPELPRTELPIEETVTIKVSSPRSSN
jgi:hypothetical protein